MSNRQVRNVSDSITLLSTWLSSMAEVKNEVDTLYEKHADTFAVVCFKPFDCEPKKEHPPVSLEPKATHLSYLLPDLVRKVQSRTDLAIDLSAIKRTALWPGSASKTTAKQSTCRRTAALEVAPAL